MPAPTRKLLIGPLVWNNNSQLFKRISEFVQKGIIINVISFAAVSFGLWAIIYASGYPNSRQRIVVIAAAFRDFRITLKYVGARIV